MQEGDEDLMKRRWIYIAALFLFLVAAILYGLAKRYLIPQVEVDLSQLQQTQQSQQLENGPSADESLPEEDQQEGQQLEGDQSGEAGGQSNTQQEAEGQQGQTEGEQLTEQEQSGSSGQAQYDDWSYKDDNIAIQISKHEQGSGSDVITYYVADVQLSDASYLQTALANNQFGRNIVDYTTSIAEDNNALLAINGDYYGFRSDGIVIRNGLLLRDEGVRTGLAIYRDGTVRSYDETQVSGEQLIADGVLHTLSFGPVLVENGEAYTNFDHVSIDKNFGNRSIQNSNPRTGFGYIAPNHYVWVVVDGRSEGYSRGMTLNEFAALFEELGAQLAYNLDGGGSSTMVFMDEMMNNPLGRQKEREVSDIIYIGVPTGEGSSL